MAKAAADKAKAELLNTARDGPIDEVTLRLLISATHVVSS